MKYHGNNIWPDERTDERDNGTAYNTASSPALSVSGGEGMKTPKI